MRSSIPHSKTDFSKNQIASRQIIPWPECRKRFVSKSRLAFRRFGLKEPRLPKTKYRKCANNTSIAERVTTPVQLLKYTITVLLFLSLLPLLLLRLLLVYYCYCSKIQLLLYNYFKILLLLLHYYYFCYCYCCCYCCYCYCYYCSTTAATTTTTTVCVFHVNSCRSAVPFGGQAT